MGTSTVGEVVEIAKTKPSEAEFARQVEGKLVGTSGFMLFHVIDHSGWLPIYGIKQRTVRWILGNPLLAVTMIRHDITAGLFAPVEFARDGECRWRRRDHNLRAAVVAYGHRQ